MLDSFVPARIYIFSQAQQFHQQKFKTLYTEWVIYSSFVWGWECRNLKKARVELRRTQRHWNLRLSCVVCIHIVCIHSCIYMWESCTVSSPSTADPAAIAAEMHISHRLFAERLPVWKLLTQQRRSWVLYVSHREAPFVSKEKNKVCSACSMHCMPCTHSHTLFLSLFLHALHGVHAQCTHTQLPCQSTALYTHQAVHCTHHTALLCLFSSKRSVCCYAVDIMFSLYCALETIGRGWKGCENRWNLCCCYDNYACFWSKMQK